MDLNPLTNDDVADILALLDSLPYDELDLETPRFRLTLRRTGQRGSPGLCPVVSYPHGTHPRLASCATPEVCLGIGWEVPGFSAPVCVAPRPRGAARPAPRAGPPRPGPAGGRSAPPPR